MKNFKFLLLLSALFLFACSEKGVDSRLDDAPESSMQIQKKSVLKGSLLHKRADSSSTVKLLELDENLAQTGHVVLGTIDSLGQYTVIAEDFKSRYALLDVNASFLLYYGCIRDTKENLSVIVDLQSDSIVDVDFATHAISARTKWLVQKKEMEYTAAWTQAESEWRDLFVIPQNEAPLKRIDWTDSSSVNRRTAVEMFFEYYADARKYKDISALHGAIVDSFEKNGSSAEGSAFSGVSMAVVSVITRKGLFGCVVDFPYKSVSENHYLDSLWISLLKEDECNAKNDGTTHPFFKTEKNVQIMMEVFPYYTCDKDHWRVATSVEYLNQTYTDEEDGTYKTFEFDGRHIETFVYDEVSGWRTSTQFESVLRSGCTKHREGVEYMGSVCKDEEWTSEVPESYFKTVCTEDGVPYRDGVDVSDKYACDSGKVITLTPMDSVLGKACLSSNKGETIEVGYSQFICDTTWKWVAGDSVATSLLDVRDSTRYRVVGVGNQHWMAENLRYGSKGGYGYYSWLQAMDIPEETNFDSLKITLPHRGVCPEGWHLPSKAEWDTLFAFVRKYEKTTTLAKSMFVHYWVFEGKYDTFGFSVRPNGRVNLSGNYEKDGQDAYFWYAIEAVESNHFPFYYLTNSKDDIQSGQFSDPHWGLNVRCIADEEGK